MRGCSAVCSNPAARIRGRLETALLDACLHLWLCTPSPESPSSRVCCTPQGSDEAI
jgi:hypothetical protein